MTDGHAYRGTIETGDRTLLADYRDIWSALCDEGPCAWITYRPEWADVYLDVHDPQARFSLIVVRHGETVRGLLPIRIRRYGIGPFAIRRAVPPADYDTWDFDLVHGAGDREAVVDAAFALLRQWRGYDVLHMVSAPDSGVVAALHERWPGVTTHHAEHSYWIPCPPAATSMAETIEVSCLTRKRQMKRLLKKLESQPGLQRRRIDIEDGTGSVMAAIDRFIALEMSGWKGTGDRILLSEGRLQDYYRVLGQKGFIVIHEIRIGDDLVASHLGVLDGDHMLALRIAYDERFADLGPGQMLTLWTVKEAGDRGCVRIDLGGTSPDARTYKTIWTDRWYGVGQYTLYAPTLRGRLTAFAVEAVLPATRQGRRKAAIVASRMRSRMQRYSDATS